MSAHKTLYLKHLQATLVLLMLTFASIGLDAQNTNSADSVTSVTPKKKSNAIDAQIVYSAQDSIVLFGNGTAFLHGTTEIKYRNIGLKADFIRVKIDSSLIYAQGTTDTLGTVTGEPVFSEGETEYNSKELKYNLRTKKGYIRHVVTEEGEGFIISDKTKKTPDDVFCIADGKYTTCENHDHPDFYLNITRGKVKPGKYIVTGPANLVVLDVPLPLAIPFGFFPFTDKYSSGVLMPSYTDEMTRGFGLTNGGYYFALNDYMDLELKGDIYTKGTWGVNATTNYVKRYKFRGSFAISYREDVTGEQGLPDYSKANNMSIRWSHSQDQKANPNFNFSSAVNFSTSGYNRSNINSYYKPELNSENTKSSSINFTKRFPELPSLSLSGSILVNQRTKDSTINLSLPNINVSYSRFYPFKRKKMIGKERWYEKIVMSYSGAFANSIDTKESKLLTSSFTRDWRNGVKHSIPVSANFNLLKYINISPNLNYTERWYFKSVEQSWDKTSQKLVKDTIDGFYRVFDYNLGVSASTKLYGYYIPIRSIFGDKVDRIRHMMTLNVGFGYRPDFGESKWGYWDSYTKSTNTTANPDVYKETQVSYTRFANSLYGVPGAGKSGAINFSLGNNVEMKIRNEKDTTGKEMFKKVSLIDNFTVSGNYNLAADSMRWSNFSTNLRLKLSKSYSLSLSAGFDPYIYGLNSSGKPVRINELRWNHGQIPKFLGTSTSYSYTFNNETFKKLFGKKGESESKIKGNGRGSDNQDENQDPTESSDNLENNERQRDDNPKNSQTSDYAAVKIPWSISASYSIRYGNTNVFNYDKMDYNMDFTHNFSLNGSLTLTQNWRITANSTYDFKAKQFTYTSINVNRSLHCWSMSASIVPFGVYKSYNFHIGVNASMLSDLKWDKQSEYGVNNITWY